MKIKQSICITAALLFLAVTGLNIIAGEPAVNPTGSWKWIAPVNGDGTTPKVTFTLKLQGETLAGTVNKSSGMITITNGILTGDKVSFQTVVEGKRGTRTTTYSGKISGDAIKGEMEVDGGGPKI